MVSPPDAECIKKTGVRTLRRPLPANFIADILRMDRGLPAYCWRGRFTPTSAISIHNPANHKTTGVRIGTCCASVKYSEAVKQTGATHKICSLLKEKNLKTSTMAHRKKS